MNYRPHTHVHKNHICNIKRKGNQRIYWMMTNLSKLRIRSDIEWFRTAPATRGPLWVWRLLPVGVLVLGCPASFSEVEGSRSLFDPFLTRPVILWLADTKESLPRFFPFLFRHSAEFTSSPFTCSLNNSKLQIKIEHKSTRTASEYTQKKHAQTKGQ